MTCSLTCLCPPAPTHPHSRPPLQVAQELLFNNDDEAKNEA
jgi:hypothetical protein